MRKVFLDPELNSLFLIRGYVVLDLLDADSCAEALSAYEKIHHNKRTEKFFTTTNSMDFSYRELCNEVITAFLAPYAQGILDDYLPLFGNYMVKPVSNNSICNLHQDWSFVDENHFRTVNAWVALEDTYIDNGCIHVIPGSHHLPFPVRGRNISWVYEDAVSPLIENLGKPLPLKKGQCVIFDSAILHYSPNNTSDKTRIAVSLMFYPAEAVLLHYVYDNGNPERITKYNVGPEFFVKFGADEDFFSADGESEAIICDKLTFETIKSMLVNR